MHRKSYIIHPKHFIKISYLFKLYVYFNYKMKLLLKTFLTLLLLSFSVDTLLAKKVDDSRIKMLNGEYAKLSDFHSDGPLIINFWTTW